MAARNPGPGARFASRAVISPQVAPVQATAMNGADLGDAVIVSAPELGVGFSVSYATRSEPIQLIAYDRQGRELGRRSLPIVPPP